MNNKYKGLYDDAKHSYITNTTKELTKEETITYKIKKPLFEEKENTMDKNFNEDFLRKEITRYSKEYNKLKKQALKLEKDNQKVPKELNRRIMECNILGSYFNNILINLHNAKLKKQQFEMTVNLMEDCNLKYEPSMMYVPHGR